MATPAHLEVTAGDRGDLFDPACPTRKLLDRLGTKWTSMTVLTLAAAHPDEVRFAELRRRIPGISQKMLAQTLLSLRRDGLVRRRVEGTVPPSVFYGLTERGETLEQPSAPSGGGRRRTWRRSTRRDAASTMPATMSPTTVDEAGRFDRPLGENASKGRSPDGAATRT